MRDEIVKLRTDRFSGGVLHLRASAVSAVFVPDNDEDESAFFCIGDDADYNISTQDAERLLSAMRYPNA